MPSPRRLRLTWADARGPQTRLFSSSSYGGALWTLGKKMIRSDQLAEGLFTGDVPKFRIEPLTPQSKPKAPPPRDPEADVYAYEIKNEPEGYAVYRQRLSFRGIRSGVPSFLGVFLDYREADSVVSIERLRDEVR